MHLATAKSCKADTRSTLLHYNKYIKVKNMFNVQYAIDAFGELLKGVQFKGGHCTTESVVMRAKSGTVRFVEGRHRLDKKPDLYIKD